MTSEQNELKARKIVEQYETRYNDTRDLLWTDLEDVALQAMEWKDEQYEKEKQQFIEKACRYIKKNVCEHINHNPLYKDYKHEEVIGFQLVVDEQFYIDFKKKMKGE